MPAWLQRTAKELERASGPQTPQLINAAMTCHGLGRFHDIEASRLAPVVWNLDAHCRDHPRGGHSVVADMTSKLRVLVACEFSGIVRNAFWEAGHEAWSCDLLPTEIASGRHVIGDVREILCSGWWDLLIAHPPCTYLATSGARWMKVPERIQKQREAVEFARCLWEAPISRICLENPRSVLSTQLCKPTQLIHPWQFGHGERKETFLWLKGLPKLVPTDIVAGRESRVHRVAPGPKRWIERSRTFTGIAAAMAAQWGGIATTHTAEYLAPIAARAI